MNSFRKEYLPTCSVGSLLYLPCSSPMSSPCPLFLYSAFLSSPLLSMIAQEFKRLYPLTVCTLPSYKHHPFLFCFWLSSLSKCVMKVQGIQMSHKKRNELQKPALLTSLKTDKSFNDLPGSREGTFRFYSTMAQDVAWNIAISCLKMKCIAENI